MRRNLELIQPVLLCGGLGQRLYPLSTPDKPKPFLNLTSELSMLQETALRVSELKPPMVLCNDQHVDMVYKDIDGINLKVGPVIGEPTSKNTGPACALAVKYFLEMEKDEILLFLPCDHVIKNLPAFHEAIEKSYDAANKDQIVLFGEQPSSPDTGYGYIQVKPEPNQKSVKTIQQFIEKPVLEDAMSYLEQGYLWNTGIMVVRTSTLLRAFQEHAPDIWHVIKDLSVKHFTDKDYSKCPDISIDYALLENMHGIMVCEVDMGWSDIGTMDRLKALA